MRTRLFIPTLLALAALSGCATGPNGQPYMGGPDNFGEANQQTYAAQVIDPTPQYDTAVPEGLGQHAAAAIERYRNDKVKKPDKVTTSNVRTSGGSGGSGGGEN